MGNNRTEWNEYFMGMARQAATRSTCPRLAVGAILVKDKRVIGTGYNGSGHGQDHCVDKGCILVDGHCVRTVHAETNALLGVNRDDLNYSVLYVTHKPCLTCFKNLVQAGIKRIIFDQPYEVDYNVLKINPNQMPSVVQFDKLLASQSQ
jgi:dCMP deaminase